MALDVNALENALIEAFGIQATDTAGREAMKRAARVIDSYLRSATVNVTVQGAAAGVMTGSSSAVVTGAGTGTLS